MEKGGKMISKKVNSVQEWLPVDEILENGIIKVKNKNYIKILKIIPINFELKSNLEKEAILNSYKIFLKTCNFDIQILIQSNKKDLSNHRKKSDACSTALSVYWRIMLVVEHLLDKRLRKRHSRYMYQDRLNIYHLLRLLQPGIHRYKYRKRYNRH